ncbi:hypothetical protein NPIL_428501 [Nephila pilipes]|uniref:Uncharacterized protein n=1 Tax=Nephila pilipes TaxID=299642 RepID=A0A8X6P3E3_NEPPI|nr:hypothetical protein NPIL_428501 [Nephila pilipes]
MNNNDNIQKTETTQELDSYASNSLASERNDIQHRSSKGVNNHERRGENSAPRSKFVKLMKISICRRIMLMSTRKTVWNKPRTDLKESKGSWEMLWDRKVHLECSPERRMGKTSQENSIPRRILMEIGDVFVTSLG